MPRNTLLPALAALLALSCGGSQESQQTGTTTTGGTGGTGTSAAPTYHADIEPLVAKHCTSCHQEGAIAPFALTTYAQVKSMAGAIAKATAERTMPPVNVDQSGACQTYKDANWLSDDEIARIQAWVDGGTVEGPPGAPVSLPEPDHLGAGAVSLTMALPYTPKPTPQSQTDDYRCFLLDPGFTEDQFVTGFEILPGVRPEVHHMLLHSILSAGDEQKAQALDDADPEPGWSCFGSGGVNDVNLVAGWAPGRDVVRYPAETGLRVAGGRKLVMQIHYNLLGGSAPDQTTVKLEVTKTVKKEAIMASLSDDSFSLPPNMADATAGKTLNLALLGIPEVELHGVFPHMHLLGTKQSLTVRETGSDPSDATCLMDVPRWDFHWQQLFFYQQPVILKSSQTIDFACHYDTRGQTKTVSVGEGTQDEMCLVYTYLTLPQGGALPL